MCKKGQRIKRQGFYVPALLVLCSHYNTSKTGHYGRLPHTWQWYDCTRVFLFRLVYNKTCYMYPCTIETMNEQRKRQQKVFTYCFKQRILYFGSYDSLFRYLWLLKISQNPVFVLTFVSYFINAFYYCQRISHEFCANMASTAMLQACRTNVIH